MQKRNIEYGTKEWYKEINEYLNDIVDYYVIRHAKDRCSLVVLLSALLASISYIYISLYVKDFCISFYIGVGLILVSFVLIIFNICLDLYYSWKLKKYTKDHRQKSDYNKLFKRAGDCK